MTGLVVKRGGRRLIRRGGGGAYRGEAAPCHKGMGPKLNFDIESAPLFPPSARYHCQRRTAIDDTFAFMFIVIDVAVIVAVSVTIAATAFS